MRIDLQGRQKGKPRFAVVGGGIVFLQVATAHETVSIYETKLSKGKSYPCA
jgi:hypothetical protein